MNKLTVKNRSPLPQSISVRSLVGYDVASMILTAHDLSPFGFHTRNGDVYWSHTTICILYQWYAIVAVSVMTDQLPVLL